MQSDQSFCKSLENSMTVNPLIHRLFLDHDIIFFDNIEKSSRKIEVLNTFENVIENGAFAPFSILFSNT